MLIHLIVILLCIGFAGLLWIRWIRHRHNTLQSGEEIMPNEARSMLSSEYTEPEEGSKVTSSPPTSMPDNSSSIVDPVLMQSNTTSSLTPIARVPRPPSIYDTSREPEDGSDLATHPHHKHFPVYGEQSNLDFGWQIIGASRRGYAHAYEGKYREDDFNIRLVGQEIALVAVADGVGSKALSRRGSRASVLGATNLSEQRLQELVQLVRKDAQNPMCQQEALAILLDALHAARAKVEDRAQKDQIDIDELQTTLLVFLAVPCDQRHLFIGSVQIGDGALFVFQPHKGVRLSDKWRCLQQQQIQPSGNEVEPFTRTNLDTWTRFLQCELLDDTTFIMGMTDGTADDIEPPRGTPENPDPYPFLYVNDFYQHITSHVLNTPQPAEALLEFLGYRKRSSYDDRTVICLYRSEEGGSQDNASQI